MGIFALTSYDVLMIVSMNVFTPLMMFGFAVQAPNYGAYIDHQRGLSHYSSASGQYLDSRGSMAGSSHAISARGPNRDPSGSSNGEVIDHQKDMNRADDITTRYVPGNFKSASHGYRPQSAPMQRINTDLGEMPSWAKKEIFAPTFDKTVDNAKARPGSARIRTQTGLPLSIVPKWISQDKKVLSFEAYFKEAVQESRLEHYRVRRCGHSEDHDVRRD